MKILAELGLSLSFTNDLLNNRYSLSEPWVICKMRTMLMMDLQKTRCFLLLLSWTWDEWMVKHMEPQKGINIPGEGTEILQLKRDRIWYLFISWTIYGIFAAYNEFHVHGCMGWDNNKPFSYQHAIALMQYQHTVTLSQSSMSNRQRR